MTWTGRWIGSFSPSTVPKFRSARSKVHIHHKYVYLLFHPSSVLTRSVEFYPLSTGTLGEMKVFESEPSGLSELKAPLGVSYRCWAAKQYSMTSSNDNATLILTNFQIQPYLDNDDNDKVFGEGNND